MPLKAETALAAALLLMASASNAAPHDTRTHDQTGMASWYGDELRGRRTANGERFNPDGISAAHPSLPMPSFVEVTALDNGRTILVRINDRGPFHGKRIIDLSAGAARQLGMRGLGARPVRVRRVYPSDNEIAAIRRGESHFASRTVSRDELAGMRTGSAWRAPVSATIAIPSGKGPLYIQIATFSSRSRASSMAGRLGAEVSPASGLYRVRLGPFENARDAKAALAPLAAKGYSDVHITR